LNFIFLKKSIVMRAILPFFLLGLLLLGACAENARQPGEADASATLYFNGDILTMEGEEPEYAEAVVVKDGKITFVGAKAEAERAAGAGYTEVDLQGKTLLPGFIDAHSHFSQTAMKLAMVPLDPPPAGDISSIEDIKSALKKEIETHPEKYQDETNWLIGWGFDNAMLAEKRFPNRRDLDEVSTEIPIMLMHFSSHIFVMNTIGMERTGYLADDYRAPEGGSLQYFEDKREPNGIVEEQAMLSGLTLIGKELSGKPAQFLDDEAMLDKMLEAQDIYLREGYTTISEFATNDDIYAKIRQLGEEGKLKADIAMAYYSLTTTVDHVKELYSTSYTDHYRVMGGKLNLDGGSPGRTAYLREPYHTPTPGQPADYRGYSSMSNQEDMNTLVAEYYKARIPFFIHALGDAAVDQCIAAVQYSEEKYGYDDIRTQLIHVQQIQPDQYETMKDLDVTLTYQNTHNFYFADFHNEYIYGPERTARLNSMKEGLENGFSVTFHHDSPIHPVDQIFLIWIAVNRKSRSGQVYGPEQCLTPYEALYSSTAEAAYQFQEEDRKGSLKPGKLADLVILDKNPLKVEPNAIKDIQVLETIKEGETVYRRGSEALGKNE